VAPLRAIVTGGALIVARRSSTRRGRRHASESALSTVPAPDDFFDGHVYYPRGYPWQCVGKVDIYPSGEAENPTASGTGVLIGDRIVLTAGHVAADISNPRDWKMRFTAGMYSGSSVVGAGGVSYVSDSQWFASGVSGHDIGLLRLYEPLGSALGYFGAKTYSRVSVAGHLDVVSPAAVTLLALEQRVDRVLDRRAAHAGVDQLRPDEAGRPIDPLARQGLEVTPQTIDALARQQKLDARGDHLRQRRIRDVHDRQPALVLGARLFSTAHGASRARTGSAYMSTATGRGWTSRSPAHERMSVVSRRRRGSVALSGG
jgi:hypothetical protein